MLLMINFQNQNNVPRGRKNFELLVLNIHVIRKNLKVLNLTEKSKYIRYILTAKLNCATNYATLFYFN